MQVVLAGILGAFVFVFGAMFRGIFGATFGALTGWFLSMIPPGAWALTAAVSLGYGGDLVEMGALLGFVGAFLSTSVTSSK